MPAASDHDPDESEGSRLVSRELRADETRVLERFARRLRSGTALLEAWSRARATWGDAPLPGVPGTLAVENPAGGFLAVGICSAGAEVLHERRMEMTYGWHEGVVGSALAPVFLEALERTACARLEETRLDGSVPAVIRATLIDDDPAGLVLEARGFTCGPVEDDLACARDRAEAPPVAGVQVLPWRDDLVPACFEAYRAAFAERPGFPDFSERAWRAFALEYDAFRPGLSRVAWQDGAVVGFALGAHDGDAAHLVQLGVVPEARRRGVARALLASFARAAGPEHERLTLSVAADNHAARACFEAVGFRRVRRRRVYRKPV